MTSSSTSPAKYFVGIFILAVSLCGLVWLGASDVLWESTETTSSENTDPYAPERKDVRRYRSGRGIEDARARSARRSAEVVNQREAERVEKARQVAQEKRDHLLAKERQRQEKTTAQQKKAVEEAARDAEARRKREIATRESELRRSLLHQAKAMALASAQPWKELLAVALLQAQIQDYGGMRDTFEKAENLAQFPDDPRATGSALNQVVSAAIRAGELELAHDIANRMTDGPLKDEAFIKVVASYARQNRITLAKTLAQVISDNRNRERALSQVSSEQVKRTGPASAINTITLISDLRLRDDALLRVSSHQARLGDFNGAESTLLQLDDPKSEDKGLAMLAREQLRKRQSDQAMNYANRISEPNRREQLLSEIARNQLSGRQFGKARQTTSLITLTPLREQVSRHLAAVQADEGQFNSAIQELSEIRSPSLKAAALKDVTLKHAKDSNSSATTHLINQVADQNAKDGAFSVLALNEYRHVGALAAVRIANQIKDPQLRQRTVMRIAEFSLDKGEVLEGKRLLMTVESEFAINPDEVPTSLKQKLVELYGRTGRVSEVLGRLAQLPTARAQDGVLSSLASKMARTEDIEGAQAMAIRIQDAEIRDRSFIQIAAEYGKQVDLEEASVAINQMHTPEEKLRFILEFFRS